MPSQSKPRLTAPMPSVRAKRLAPSSTAGLAPLLELCIADVTEAERLAAFLRLHLGCVAVVGPLMVGAVPTSWSQVWISPRALPRARSVYTVWRAALDR